jgi:predicted outer membrane repeat protein
VVNTEVTIPAGANPFETGYTTITATSVISPALQRVAIIETIVRPNIDLSFAPDHTATLQPGDAITFTHQLTNTGDYTETFHLTLGSDPLGWGQLLPANNFALQLAPEQVINVRVRIEVPPFAAAGLFNPVEVIATSDFDPTIQASVVNTVTASGTVGPRYVSLGGTDLNNNCTQITFPCRTIAHTVGQAASGDTIHIAQGTYSVSDIGINDTLHLSGGWNNSFQSQGENPALTVLEGTGGRLFAIAPGSSLLPTFTNLTLANGNATTGGAVSVGSQAQPRFSQVHFVGNQAGQGGAIHAGTSSLVRH